MLYKNNAQGSQFDGSIKASNFNPLTIAKSQLNTSISYYLNKTSFHSDIAYIK